MLKHCSRFWLNCIRFFRSFERSVKVPRRIVDRVGQCLLVDELRLRVINHIKSFTPQGQSALQPRISFRIFALTSIVTSDVEHRRYVFRISCGEILDERLHLQTIALCAQHHKEIRISIVLTSGQLLRHSYRIEIAVECRSCIHFERIGNRCTYGADALRFVQNVALSNRHHLSVIHDGTTHILHFIGSIERVVRKRVVCIYRKNRCVEELSLLLVGEKSLLPCCTHSSNDIASREKRQFLGRHSRCHTHHIVVVTRCNNALHLGLATFDVSHYGTCGSTKCSVRSNHLCGGRCEISVSRVESVAFFIESHHTHHSLLCIVGLLCVAQMGKESQCKREKVFHW